MKDALRDFCTTDDGLLSASVIAVTLGMGVFFRRCIRRHIREERADLMSGDDARTSTRRFGSLASVESVAPA